MMMMIMLMMTLMMILFMRMMLMSMMMLLLKTAAWLNFYSDWLNHNDKNNLLVLHYENIMDNLRHTLRKVVDFLGFEEDQGRIDCASKLNTGE